MILRERTINRTMQTSAGTKRVGMIDELAFDSIGDLLSNTRPYKSASTSLSWLGVRDVKELDGYVEDGWPEMERRMNAMLKEIRPDPAELRPEINRKRRRVKRDFGNEVDIHAINQGRMDRAWDTTVVEEVPTVGNKLVHININLSASCGVAFDAGLWRGAAAMRVYDVLMRMGKSVAISGMYAAYLGYTDGTTGVVSCRLKSYGEPLRADRLAAMVTLGFMRNYLMGRGMDAHPSKKADDCRGFPIDDYELLTRAAESDLEHGGAVVSIGQCFDRRQAQDVVDKFIRQYTRDEKVESLTAYEQTKNWRSKDAPHYE